MTAEVREFPVRGKVAQCLLASWASSQELEVVVACIKDPALKSKVEAALRTRVATPEGHRSLLAFDEIIELKLEGHNIRLIA